MFHGGPESSTDPAGEQPPPALRRIAAALGISVGSFFGPAPGEVGGSGPRSRSEQADALMRLFDRVPGPKARERIIALVEAELAALETKR